MKHGIICCVNKLEKNSVPRRLGGKKEINCEQLLNLKTHMRLKMLFPLPNNATQVHDKVLSDTTNVDRQTVHMHFQN